MDQAINNANSATPTTRAYTTEYIYDAFASYATDPDGELVRKVEAILEGFHRRPDLPSEYAHEIELCVDGRDFVFPRHTRGGRTNAIEPIVRAYQGRSRSLIIFCGPLSRDHPWINKEIEWWITDRPGDPVYFAMTYGRNPDRPSENMPAALFERGGADNFVFFDLRGFYLQQSLFRGSQRQSHIQDNASEWKSVRPFDEEVAKLAATLVSDATGNAIAVADLIEAYAESERLTARRSRMYRAVAICTVAIVAVVAWIFVDRFVQTQETIALTSKLQAAVDQRQYERAMRIGLQALPVPGELPWALGWSDPHVVALELSLAGAAQLSSLVAELKEHGPVRTASFDREGQRIVTAVEDGTASVWNMQTLAIVGTCTRDDAVPSEARGDPPWFMSSNFSPDGSLIATTSHDKVAWIWHATAPNCKDRILLQGHTDAVSSAAFSHDGMRIVTASEDGTTIIWEGTITASEARIHWKTVGHPRIWNHKLSGAEFSPDGKSILVSAWDGFVAMADMEAAGQVRVLQDANRPSVWSARYNRDGKYLITASADGSVVVYNASSGTAYSFLPRQSQPVNSAAFSDDGDYIVTASADNTARIWDIRNPTSPIERFTFQGHSKSVRHVEFNSKGDRIVSSSSDATVRIWDAVTDIKATFLESRGQPAHRRSVRSIEFSSKNDRFITASDDQTAKIWSVNSDGSKITLDQEFTWPNGGIASAAFEPDGHRIVITTTDGKVLLWDTKDHPM